ncbi:MAG: NfeD family protein, partial [Balneolaceae bacterium]|nr:NfeD family protein [Balneolaceae bacterium]
FGLLIAGGAVSFFLGALMLFQDLPEPMELSWAWLVPATILTTVFFVWIVSAGIKAQLTGSRTGTETMIGKRAEVVDKVNEKGGRVFISGEYWNAFANEEIKKGDMCEVEAVEGLKLKVRPASEQSAETTTA